MMRERAATLLGEAERPILARAVRSPEHSLPAWVPFLIKMTALASAIGLQVAIHRVPHMCGGTAWSRLATCLSFARWFGVVYAGRAISFEILFGA